jgi:hypothetical protein
MPGGGHKFGHNRIERCLGREPAATSRFARIIRQRHYGAQFSIPTHVRQHVGLPKRQIRSSAPVVIGVGVILAIYGTALLLGSSQQTGRN